MTDLNKLRSEFEGIPEIKTHLDHGNVFGVIRIKLMHLNSSVFTQWHAT